MSRPISSHDVTIIKISNEWRVIVRESGIKEPHIAEFRNEDFALNYAEGQRARLGLSSITGFRPAAPSDPDAEPRA